MARIVPEGISRDIAAYSSGHVLRMFSERTDRRGSPEHTEEDRDPWVFRKKGSRRKVVDCAMFQMDEASSRSPNSCAETCYLVDSSSAAVHFFVTDVRDVGLLAA